MVGRDELPSDHQDPDAARVAYQAAVGSGHTDRAAKAAFDLGLLLKRNGDLVGARIAYQIAIDSHHPEPAPKAAFKLGLLRHKQGDLPGPGLPAS